MISFATRNADIRSAKQFSGRGLPLVLPMGLIRVVATFLFWSAITLGLVSTGHAEVQIKPESYGYFDFPTCVRYALVHSEDLTKNRIDIQLASIDLKDAHSEILPTLQVTTRYYLVRTFNVNDPNANNWNVQFVMLNWNPYLALLKIKSKSTMVDIAKISHFDKISDATANIARLFYGIHTLEKSIRGSKQILALVQDKLNFGKSMNDQGKMDPLELQALQNNYRSQQIKIRSLENELQDNVSQLKAIIGYHPDYYLPLDTRDAANQILNGFRSNWITFTDIQGSNLQLKISAKKEQVQSNSVTGAYVALVPQPQFVFQQDTNTPNATSGLNMAIGVDYKLWDGFERVRDIRRQKLIGPKIQP